MSNTVHLQLLATKIECAAQMLFFTLITLDSTLDGMYMGGERFSVLATVVLLTVPGPVQESNPAGHAPFLSDILQFVEPEDEWAVRKACRLDFCRRDKLLGRRIDVGAGSA